MFSWICARCGRDNPPSANHCISCGASFDAATAEAEAAPPSYAAPSSYAPEVEDDEPVFVASASAARPVARPASPPPPPAPAPPPPVTASTQGTGYTRSEPPLPKFMTAAPPQAAKAPAPRPERQQPPRPPVEDYVASPPRQSLPTWLLTILSFLAIMVAGALIYYGIQYFRGGKAATSTGLDPAANVARTKISNPLQKSVEVVGIRLTSDARKKPQARFIVVNHSPTEIDDLEATVTLWASTSRSEEDSIGTFTFKIGALPGYESKELATPLNTKLKMYELPDWQNATAEVQITSP